MIPQWLADEVREYHINLSHPPKTILDIGANIGAFSAWARKQWPEAVINAYEPVAENYRRLRDNTENTGVICWEHAVRDFSAYDHIWKGDADSTSSFHKLGRQTDQSEEVHCVNADILPRAELVKIDTEGCEVEILRGLDLAETKAVLCEYHRSEDATEIKSILEAQGFELVRRIEYTTANGLLKYYRPGAVVKPPKPNIFIAIPTYGGTPIEFAQCLMKLQADPPCDYSMIFMPGDSLVSRARNSLTSEFLKSDCTHLLFIDSDLIFSSGQINRLIDHDEDLVAGFYPKKKEGAVEWVCNALVNAPLPCGLQEVRYMGTGFMLVKRVVFERMIAAFGREMGYISDSTKHAEFDFWSVGGHASPDDGNFAYNPELLAEVMAFGLNEADAKHVLRKRYLSEDWFFCQRWLDLGGKIYGDTRVILRHIGMATYPLKSQMSDLMPK